MPPYEAEAVKFAVVKIFATILPSIAKTQADKQKTHFREFSDLERVAGIEPATLAWKVSVKGVFGEHQF